MLLSGFVVYFLFHKYLYNPILEKKYLSDYDIVIGKLEKFTKENAGKYWSAEVNYSYSGVEYNIDLVNSIPCKEVDRKSNKSIKDLRNYPIPVLVSKLDPNYYIPIVTKKDYKKFGLVFPDSLKVKYEKYIDCSFFERM